MCWTGSPITWSGTSISRHCLPRRGRRASPGPRDMHREPHAENYAGQEQAGEGIETQGARDIGSARRWRAGTNPRILDAFLGIIARTGERQPKRAGHRRLGPAGIRRMVLFRIAQHRREGAPGGAFAGEYRGGRQQRSAEPCRYDIQQIVKPCRRPAKGAIARRAVADHAVERVRHLVGEKARQAEQQIPEHRRDDPVAEILGEALDRGAGHAMRIETQRVAPDDMPDRLAPSRQAAPFEREHNNRDMFIEPALSQEDADDECLDERAEYTAAAQPLDPGADRRCRADQHDDRDDAALAPTPVAAARAVELAVEESDG